MLGSFVEHPKNVTYDGADKDEKILYVLRQSIVVNIPWMLLVILMAIIPSFVFPMLPTFIDAKFRLMLFLFWYLILIGYTFQRVLNWFFNVYIISNKKIVDVDFHGILYKNISEALLNNIEDVTSTVHGFWGVVFNFGDVTIQTAAEEREFDFGNIDNPSVVRDIISDLVAERRHHKK
ncbi:hypothetical protein A3K42_00645 [candidate division WWE3 bacterium RBG_13_37_7]|uniref:DUF304 domain-containing protein n=1 Tax=candidate division WWE3 bacterium RBG_13_37_7 TaxID=1802609 RepID=A0A1F4U2H3_UNCKA|nr:MAG: hypothetical protein A3K42_00645 [candidate division WWE3 bacterium RBG_13_37_7]